MWIFTEELSEQSIIWQLWKDTICWVHFVAMFKYYTMETHISQIQLQSKKNGETPNILISGFVLHNPLGWWILFLYWHSLSLQSWEHKYQINIFVFVKILEKMLNKFLSVFNLLLVDLFVYRFCFTLSATIQVIPFIIEITRFSGWYYFCAANLGMMSIITELYI